jgi:DNA polymerase III epsilon subunit-like protein
MYSYPRLPSIRGTCGQRILCVMSTVFFDTETTGLNKSRLIELAYSVDGAMTVLRCKPPIEIEMEARAIHHIDPEDLEDLLPFEERPDYQTIKELFESNIVVAHNAEFDIGVLNREGIFPTDIMCSKKRAKEVWPSLKSYSLQYLRHSLQMRLASVAHSAAGDVEVLIALWKKLDDATDSPSEV